MKNLIIRNHLQDSYQDVYTPEALDALEHLGELNQRQKELMLKRSKRRTERILGKQPIAFLEENGIIEGTAIKIKDARDGRFNGSIIPEDLQCQWIQGTGPAAKPNSTLESSIRNVAYALLSGADGWMFDGEDALGQIDTMSLDNQRNLKLAIDHDPLFMKVAEQVSKEMNKWALNFLDQEIISDWQKQLDFTTIIFRVRGLHLDDRHIRTISGESFSASITDMVLYVVNNYKRIQKNGASIVLYLPKIQTAEEAAFWNDIISMLETYLDLQIGDIKTYVLVEQLEATFQLMEIRAALSPHFVGFNTGRWDYINSVSDAMAGNAEFINPNIEEITMSYPYMAAYEDRVRRAVNTPDNNELHALWQGGMEPNIPVGSASGVQQSMTKAIAGAKRECQAGASGKWVAHWKMVHIIRPVWEKRKEKNQLNRQFPPLEYNPKEEASLVQLGKAPITLKGARNLLSVGIQYGNAFLQGFQAAALKPADYFNEESVLYLMEDMATGEIRLSVLWEWLHKGAKINEVDGSTGLPAGTTFTKDVFERLLEEEYQKLMEAKNKDVHDHSKTTTLPISRAIVERYVTEENKAPWFIDLLNLNLNNHLLSTAHCRIEKYYATLKKEGRRLTENLDFNI